MSICGLLLWYPRVITSMIFSWQFDSENLLLTCCLYGVSSSRHHKITTLLHYALYISKIFILYFKSFYPVQFVNQMGKITKSNLFWCFRLYMYILTLYIFFQNAVKKVIHIYIYIYIYIKLYNLNLYIYNI